MKIADAIFSEDRNYRYVLWRIWDKEKPMINIIGLNPATADELVNDPTMRRCSSFARSWGFGGYYMTNLFAYRTAFPTELFKTEDPIGNDNNKWIIEIASRVEKVVLAWGINGVFMNRNSEVLKLVESKAFCIGITKHGHPKHPLYLKSDLNIQKYPPLPAQDSL